MKYNKALYPGVFDPPTNGHLWLVTAGLEVFDQIIVSIANNPTKNPMFTIEERIEIWNRCIQKLDLSRVIIKDNKKNFSVDEAVGLECQFLLRGIRTAEDYHYELSLQKVNHDINSSITPVYLMSPPEISDISSSLVRSMVGLTGWKDYIRKYVPDPVFDALTRKHKNG